MQQKPNLSINSEPVFPVLEKALKELSYPEIIELVRCRRDLGVSKYGQELHTFNGRNSQQDATEEILDCLQYVTQLCMEQTASDLLVDKDRERIELVYKRVLTSLLEVYFSVQEHLHD